jgi:hypothetical protein
LTGGLVLFLLLYPLGFLVHASPRFPGSLAGTLLGIAGAMLICVPLIYLLIKRIPSLRARVTKHVPLRSLLTIHIYAGILGPILGLLHSAHKFRSPLGVSLTGMMLVVVLSGYVGRYLLGQVGAAIEGRRSELAALTLAFEQSLAEVSVEQRRPGLLSRPLRTALFGGPRATELADPVRLAAAVADVEYAIRAEEVMRDLFSKWLKLHIVIATVLYALLALHVWTTLYFGLRWL